MFRILYGIIFPKCVLVVVFLSTLMVVVGGIGYQCCGMFQMDTRGAVVVEGSRPLIPGVYKAVQFRSCNNNPFAIQLWDCLTDLTSCTLKWQRIITPTANDSVVVNFDTPVTIEPSYRLGLFSPRSSDLLLPVPYGIESSLAFLSEGVDAFSSFGQFQLQTIIDLKLSTWTRSFAKSLVFCGSVGCTDTPSSSLAPITPVSENPNQPPFGQCCRGNAMCDLGDTITTIEKNDVLINTLKKTVNELEVFILTLKPGEPQPARCPPNFVAGDYGLESCYLVVRENLSMAEAALTCRDNSQSTLVQINTEAENNFLAQLAIRNGGDSDEETFWIAAMFEIPLSEWFWYDTNLETKYPINFTKWRGGIKPIAQNRDESCSSFVVNYVATQAYWVKSQCNSRKYFICEVPKECD